MWVENWAQPAHFENISTTNIVSPTPEYCFLYGMYTFGNLEPLPNDLTLYAANE